MAGERVSPARRDGSGNSHDVRGEVFVRRRGRKCRPEGIEQSFVFATRPAGSGDLVVRGAITHLSDAPLDGMAAHRTRASRRPISPPGAGRTSHESERRRLNLGRDSMWSPA